MKPLISRLPLSPRIYVIAFIGHEKFFLVIRAVGVELDLKPMAKLSEEVEKSFGEAVKQAID